MTGNPQREGGFRLDLPNKRPEERDIREKEQHYWKQEIKSRINSLKAEVENKNVRNEGNQYISANIRSYLMKIKSGYIARLVIQGRFLQKTSF